MPMYEYRCAECGLVYEQLKRMSDADKDLICPNCRSEEVQRMVSACSIGGGCGPSGGGGGFS